MSASSSCRLAVLISGRGSNMLAIAHGCQSGDIAARVVLVIADRDATGIAAARAQGLATAILRPEPHQSREEFDRRLARAIDEHAPDYLVLAGFMRILSSQFVEHYRHRLLNIHPSLLPALPGLHTHRRALSERLAHHGASVHLVTAELDAGPVLRQGRLVVSKNDTEQSLSARVQAIEHIIYPRVLAQLASGRLQISGDRPTLDGKVLTSPPLEEF
ncbi:MAG: phosphoribosylglycinamide formyltransferase [Steroidobacteraceae bacterium]